MAAYSTQLSTVDSQKPPEGAGVFSAKGAISTDTRDAGSSEPMPEMTATWSRRASRFTEPALPAFWLMVTATPISTMVPASTSRCSVVVLRL